MRKLASILICTMLFSIIGAGISADEVSAEEDYREITNHKIVLERKDSKTHNYVMDDDYINKGEIYNGKESEREIENESDESYKLKTDENGEKNSKADNYDDLEYEETDEIIQDFSLSGEERFMQLEVQDEDEPRIPEVRVSVKNLTEVIETVHYNQVFPLFLQAELPEISETEEFRRMELKSNTDYGTHPDAENMKAVKDGIKVYLANINEESGVRTVSDIVELYADREEFNEEWNNKTVVVRIKKEGFKKVNAPENRGKTLIAEIPMKMRDDTQPFTKLINDCSFLYSTVSQTDSGYEITAPETPYVYLGDINFVKKDGDMNTGIKNVGFRISAYVKTEISEGTGGNLNEFVKVVNGPEEGGELKWADLTEKGRFMGWVDTEEEAGEVFTDSDGNFSIKGLPYGDDIDRGHTMYMLHETSAPEGYMGLSGPAEVNLKGVKIQDEPELYGPEERGTIYNRKYNSEEPVLPETGGEGAGHSVLGGLGIITVSLFIYLKRLF